MLPSKHVDNKGRIYTFKGWEPGMVSPFLLADPHFLDLNVVQKESFVICLHVSTGKAGRYNTSEVRRALGARELVVPPWSAGDPLVPRPW